jgi:hypothetical protein
MKRSRTLFIASVSLATVEKINNSDQNKIYNRHQTVVKKIRLVKRMPVFESYYYDVRTKTFFPA